MRLTFLERAADDALLHRLHQAGHRGIRSVTRGRVLHLQGNGPLSAERFCEALCAIPLETVSLSVPSTLDALEIGARAGVSSPDAEALLGLFPELTAAYTARRYVVTGDWDAAAVGMLLADPQVERWAVGNLAPCFVTPGPSLVQADPLPFIALDDEALLRLSADRRLALDRAELKALQLHFQGLGRDPTALELEMLAQTWSEHCVHKTFRATIEVSDRDTGQVRTVHGLLDLLERVTRTLDRPWVHSAFVDNAGLVRFDDRLDLAIKVETHNRPTALDPYGGAHTGIGGCIRDVLGVSARPVANLDVLCFGSGEAPEGALSPERVEAGVVAGIAHYGNTMGIPTVAGAVLYDPGYLANPLVFAGCVGVLPRGIHPTQARPGDHVVVIGGRTGRDGLRGATFSSAGLSAFSAETSGTAVQIGHPLLERQVQEVVCEARDAGLYTAITDCGAGGLSSAIGELARTLGAHVHLERVPTKVGGLTSWELWLSESQERMVLAVPEAHWAALRQCCARHEVPVASLGHFTADGMIRIDHHGTRGGELTTALLHHGRPPRTLSARVQAPVVMPTPTSGPVSAADLLTLLGSANLRSRKPIVRQYDHEVQGGTLARPLVGHLQDAPGDGAVLVPRDHAPVDPRRGFAIGLGIQPWIGQLDPYAMAWAAIDEAMRNAVVVGADPGQLCLVDNFCWGDVHDPDVLGALVRTVEGCADAALHYGLPFVSGKDSLHNTRLNPDGSRTSIPGTLLITALGIVPEVGAVVQSAFTHRDSVVVLVGTTRGGLGGSAWSRECGTHGGIAPQPCREAHHNAAGVHQLLLAGVVRSAHDISDGGLLLAFAEMTLGHGIGVHLELDAVPTDHALPALERAFAETGGRYLLELAPDALAAAEELLTGIPHAVIGHTGPEASFTLQAAEIRWRIPVADLRGAHFSTSPSGRAGA